MRQGHRRSTRTKGMPRKKKPRNKLCAVFGYNQVSIDKSDCYALGGIEDCGSTPLTKIAMQESRHLFEGIAPMKITAPTQYVMTCREEFVARPIAILLIKRGTPHQFDRPTSIASVVNIDTIGNHPIGNCLSQLSVEPMRKASIFQIKMTLNRIIQQIQHCVKIRFRG